MTRIFSISFALLCAVVSFAPIAANASSDAHSAMAHMAIQERVYLPENSYGAGLQAVRGKTPQSAKVRRALIVKNFDQNTNQNVSHGANQKVSQNGPNWMVSGQVSVPSYGKGVGSYELMVPHMMPNQVYTRRPQSYPQPYQSVAVKVSASQAKSIALRYVPGSEFLDIKLIGGKTYRVRVMKQGRRIDVFVDAFTGRIS